MERIALSSHALESSGVAIALRIDEVDAANNLRASGAALRPLVAREDRSEYSPAFRRKGFCMIDFQI